MLNAETKQRLLDRLNEVHEWPSVYMFKLIFEPETARLEKVLALFPPESELLRKYSAGGKYLSITAREVMINAEEVVARLEVMLRRSGFVDPAQRPTRIVFADIELDDETHEVWKDGELVALSPTEFTLLRYFMVNAGTVLSKPRILDHVWNYDFGGDVNVVESYVSYLRRKIDTGDKHLIHTLRGVGYVMREPR